MLPQNISDINKEMVRKICDENWRESGKLDFKRELPKKTQADRKEFAKDVCAMANAEGGDLIFGIAEDDGAAAKLMPLSGESKEYASQRLRHVVNDWLEPILTGVQIEPIELENGYVLVVRVPQSFSGPHCVRDSDKRRFMVRDDKDTRSLSYEELRRFFDRSGTLARMARDFRLDRLEKMKKREIWGSMYNGPYCVLHWIPVSAMMGKTSFSSDEMVSVKNRLMRVRNFTNFYQPRGLGYQKRFNLDGITFFHNSKSPSWNVQIFRSGILEMVFAPRLATTVENVVEQEHLARDLLWVMDGLGEILLSPSAVGPAIVGVSLLFVGNYGLNSNINCADRAHLVLPENWIEDVREVTDIDQIARPVLDMIWQCFGLPKCDYFDENGARTI